MFFYEGGMILDSTALEYIVYGLQNGLFRILIYLVVVAV